jgi:transposase
VFDSIAMASKDPIDLKSMNRAFFETLDQAALVELVCRLHALTVDLSERVGQNSANSSRPPSSDSPFAGPLPGLGGRLPGKLGPSKPETGPGASSSAGSTPPDPKRKPGKQPGAKGVWRSEALTAERSEDHYPSYCEWCGAALELWFPHEGASAHLVLDLERQAAGLRVACV